MSTDMMEQTAAPLDLSALAAIEQQSEAAYRSLVLNTAEHGERAQVDTREAHGVIVASGRTVAQFTADLNVARQRKAHADTLAGLTARDGQLQAMAADEKRWSLAAAAEETELRKRLDAMVDEQRARRAEVHTLTVELREAKAAARAALQATAAPGESAAVTKCQGELDALYAEKLALEKKGATANAADLAIRKVDLAKAAERARELLSGISPTMEKQKYEVAKVRADAADAAAGILDVHQAKLVEVMAEIETAKQRHAAAFNASYDDWRNMRFDTTAGS